MCNETTQTKYQSWNMLDNGINNQEDIDYSPIQNLVNKTCSSYDNAHDGFSGAANALNELKDFLKARDLKVDVEETIKYTQENQKNKHITFKVVRRDGKSWDVISSKHKNGPDDNIDNIIVPYSANSIDQGKDNNISIEDNSASDKNNESQDKTFIIAQYVQAQLNEVFDFTYDTKYDSESIERMQQGVIDARAKFIDTQELTLRQTQYLFDVISYVYDSVEKVEEVVDQQESKYILLELIDNIATEEDEKDKILSLYEQHIIVKLQNNKKLTRKEVEFFNKKLNTLFDGNMQNLFDNAYIDTLMSSNERAEAKSLYGQIKDIKNLKKKLDDVKPKNPQNSENQSCQALRDHMWYTKELEYAQQLAGLLTDRLGNATTDDFKGVMESIERHLDDYGIYLRGRTDRQQVLQRDCFLEYGHKEIIGIKLDDIHIPKYVLEEEQSLRCKRDRTNKELELLDNDYKYDTSIMLEDSHVLPMVQHLLTKELSKEKANGVDVRIINLVEARKEEKTSALINALLYVKTKQKPASLLVSNDSHWITVTVLPDIHDPNGIILCSMDSLVGCGLASRISQEVTNICKKFELHIQEDAQNNKIHNLSVEGQQVGNCCGLAAVCNSTSMIKAWHDMKETDNGFQKDENGKLDIKKFKNDFLLKNVFYRQDNGKTILRDNEESNNDCKKFVQEFGGEVLQAIAPNDVRVKYRNVFDYVKNNKKDIQTVVQFLAEKCDKRNTDRLRNTLACCYNVKCNKKSATTITISDKHEFIKLFDDTKTKELLLYILHKQINSGKVTHIQKLKEEEYKTKLEKYVNFTNDAMSRIQDALEECNDVQLSVIDAIIIWLCNVDWIRRVLDMIFNIELIKVLSGISALENDIKNMEPKIETLTNVEKYLTSPNSNNVVLAVSA